MLKDFIVILLLIEKFVRAGGFLGIYGLKNNF